MAALIHDISLCLKEHKPSLKLHSPLTFQPFTEQNMCIMPFGKDHMSGSPFSTLLCFVLFGLKHKQRTLMTREKKWDLAAHCIPQSHNFKVMSKNTQDVKSVFGGRLVTTIEVELDG